MRNNVAVIVSTPNKDNIETAVALQYLAIPSEFVAIFIAFQIFQTILWGWFFCSLILLLFRCYFFVFSKPATQLQYFIYGNICSIIIWFSFGIICAALPVDRMLIAALLVAGLVAGAMLFLTYIKYLYVFYSIFTLGAFALCLLLQGGILTFCGLGLSILVVFLSFLSLDYYNLLSKYFALSAINAELLQEETEQTAAVTELKATLDNHIVMRKEMEKKILSSNDLIQKRIQESTLADERLKLEIIMICEKMDDGILLVEEGSQHFWANAHFLRTWGLSESVFTTQQLHDIVASAITSKNNIFIKHFCFTKTTLWTTRNFEFETIDGRIFSVILKLFSTNGQLQNLWIFKDITDTRRHHLSINNLVMYDTLTQLPSRRVIHETLVNLMDEYQHGDKLLAITFLDIDDFKLINDSMGHAIGNEILQIFSKRLKHNIRESDFVGRLSGDEFICIFTGLNYKSDVDPIIKKLREALEKKVTIASRELSIKASIGISFYPCDAQSFDELIRFADIAMYKAKESKGTALYERFLPEYHASINQVNQLGQELKTALVKKSFYLVYQPIYEVNTNKIGKVEVLLRWREHISPDVFIPLAEKLGLIQEIGLWVMKEACEARHQFAEFCDPSVKFCINVSSRQLQSAEYIDKLFEVVSLSECQPSWLEFELTESTLVDLDKAVLFIGKLKEMGITVAIDDFGTGFSSLSYLKNLHFDSIKIDKKFVQNIFESERDQNMVDAIIHLSHMLGAKITVEGVETQQQFEFFKDKNCHFIQGYLFAKPLDYDVLVSRLQRDHNPL